MNRYCAQIGMTVKITNKKSYLKNFVDIGDIGIITYCAKTDKCSVHIPGKQSPYMDNKYGNPEDFWIPYDCIEEYKFKKGDRVEIVSKNSKHKGKFGTVKRLGIGYNNYIGIEIDGIPLDRFCDYNAKFVKTSLKLIQDEKENKSMKLTGFNKVAVIEINSHDYLYALFDDFTIGDNVLVTGRSDNKILTIKNIISVEEAKNIFKKDITEEVKTKVDFSAYNERVEKRRKADELRREMDKKIAEMDEMNKYTMYAERNPELAKMLEAYRELV